MITVTFKGQRVKVLIKDGQLKSVHLPGDLMPITDKLTEADKKVIERRAFKKMVRG